MTVRIVLGAALLAGSITAAAAADLHRGGSVKDGYMPAHHFLPMGWYVRGDFSYGWYENPDIFEPPNYQLTSTTIGSTWGLGGGVGYYFSRHVRGDITVDWLAKADVQGTITDTSATFNGTRDFGVKTTVALANLYYDIDIRSHFTPYVGVGLGVAHNTTTAGTVTPICGCAAEFDGASSWNAAGALMAGFSVNVRDRLHLDAGYRLLYLGDAHTGDLRGTNGGTSTTSNDPHVSDLLTHQVRVGVRWDIR